MPTEVEELLSLAKNEIPSVGSIIDLVWQNTTLTKEDVFMNFGSVLVEFDRKATEKFLEYEKKAIRKLALMWVERQGTTIKEKLKEILQDEENFAERLAEIFSDFAQLVQRLEKDLGNMRKARGGATFERLVLKFLNYISIPCEDPGKETRERLGRIDLVIPSERVALETPDKAVFITCKRTLRERWKQEVPSARPNWRVYLLTIDNSLSEQKAEEIRDLGLIVYVKDELKNKFENSSWVRKLSDLPKDLSSFIGWQRF